MPNSITNSNAPDKICLDETSTENPSCLPDNADILQPCNNMHRPHTLSPSMFSPHRVDATETNISVDSARTTANKDAQPPVVYFVRDASGTPTKPSAKQISEGLARRGLPITNGPQSSKRNGGNSSSQPFNLLSAILRHSDLTLAFACCLHPHEMLSLYCISKPFYYFVNSHYTTYVLQNARLHAPEAEQIFPPRCYSTLCVRDPVQRRHAGQNDNGSFVTKSEDGREVRLVPSLRWLQMVEYREKAVDQILLLLAMKGHQLPARVRQTIKKIWFLMDAGSNATRVSLIHDRSYFTDDDLFLATGFFIKLDMCFMDPIDGQGETSLRKLLLGQRSLSSLLRVLRGEWLTNYEELCQGFVRYAYEPSHHYPTCSVFGVPAAVIGKMGMEGWGKGTTKFLRPDELVMREGIQRGLNLQEQYFEMMLWGYVHPATHETVPVPSLNSLKLNDRGDVEEAGEE